MNRRSRNSTFNLSKPTAPSRERTAPAICPRRKRLAEGFAYLERLDSERAQGRNPVSGSFMERLIVWRELVELELQSADEQIERICAGASEDLD
jgi:hypothetical protein